MPLRRSALDRRSANPWTNFARAVNRNPRWLRVFVEGDSWFAFPGITNRTNLIGHLLDSFNAKFAVYRVDHAGDLVAEMLKGRSLEKIRRKLKLDSANFQLLLFSGGGNDLIDQIDKIVVANSSGTEASDFIDQIRLDLEVDKVIKCYQKLIDMRDQYRPNCWIYSHTYDHAKPSGRAVRVFGKNVKGPWILPKMKSNEVPVVFRQDVTDIIIDSLAVGLLRLAHITRRFIVVDTRGSLGPRQWGDEIHPTSTGFKVVAGVLATRLASRFPGKIESSA